MQNLVHATLKQVQGDDCYLLRLAINGTVRNHIENWTFPLILAHLSLRSCLCSACQIHYWREQRDCPPPPESASQILFHLKSPLFLIHFNCNILDYSFQDAYYSNNALILSKISWGSISFVILFISWASRSCWTIFIQHDKFFARKFNVVFNENCWTRPTTVSSQIREFDLLANHNQSPSRFP